MSDIALIIGAGLGGIGLGTIIAAGYLYSNKDREALENTAAGIAQSLRPDQLAQRSINIRTQKIIEENKAREEKTRKDPEKIKRLENLYTDIKSLDETLRPINDKLDDETIPEEERTSLETERGSILERVRKIEKEIKKYDDETRQLAKNNLAFGLPDFVVKQEESVASQEENNEYQSEASVTPDEIPNEISDEIPDEDLNMPIERSSSSSFSSNPPYGGSKYFTLTYTPKKLTKKDKSNNKITKRNKINKIITKRNKRKTKRN